MVYQPKEGSGALCKNEHKQGGDNKPYYRGNFRGLDGKDYDLAAWVKDGKKGKFLSLKVSEPRQKEAPKEAPAQAEKLDDEIPF